MIGCMGTNSPTFEVLNLWLRDTRTVELSVDVVPA
jgi:hypothetical protein